MSEFNFKKPETPIFISDDFLYEISNMDLSTILDNESENKVKNAISILESLQQEGREQGIFSFDDDDFDFDDDEFDDDDY